MKYAKQALSIFLICFVLIFTSMLTGCKDTNDLTPSTLTKNICAKLELNELTSLSGSNLPAHFQIQDTDIKRFSVLIDSSSSSADTVAAFEVIDDKQQTAVVTGISSYITKLTTSFENTITSEYQKTQNRILVKIDNIILLVISANPESLEEYLSSLSAQPIY